MVTSLGFWHRLESLGRRSSLLTSQLPVAAWHKQFKDATIADAILDRLVYDSYRLELEGGSMRKTTSTLP